MEKMNDLHIRIAEVLIECVRQQQTITYEDLCKAIHYPAPRAVGKKLGKLSEFTHDKYGIFYFCTGCDERDPEHLKSHTGFWLL